MSASKVELVGGNFQDSQGNLLVNGYLKMKLSSDEEVNDSLICSGIEITVTLDANGNAVAGQYIWGNDVMSRRIVITLSQLIPRRVKLRGETTTSKS